MRKYDPKTVHLGDLQRYVFTSEYNPQLAPGGEHELVFTKTEGMLCSIGSVSVGSVLQIVEQEKYVLVDRIYQEGESLSFLANFSYVQIGGNL